MTRVQISALLVLAASSWALVLWVSGAEIGYEDLKPFSVTVSVLVGAVVLFNLYCWRWPIFRGWLADRPVLKGSWKVQLSSSFKDEGAADRKEIEAYFIVRQTYLHTSIRAFTAETSSKTLSVHLTKDEDGVWTMEGVYLDTPSTSVRDRSQIHFGAFHVVLSGNPVSSFQGQYWTDRETRGNLASMGSAAPATYGSFEEAKRAHAP